jgi:flavin-dependent dehydrogenase
MANIHLFVAPIDPAGARQWFPVGGVCCVPFWLVVFPVLGCAGMLLEKTSRRGCVYSLVAADISARSMASKIGLQVLWRNEIVG